MAAIELSNAQLQLLSWLVAERSAVLERNRELFGEHYQLQQLATLLAGQLIEPTPDTVAGAQLSRTSTRETAHHEAQRKRRQHGAGAGFRKGRAQ